MTSAESVELLFRLNVQGQPEAERLAGAIQTVGTAGTAAAANLTSLESAIATLTTATLANTAALDAMAGTTGAGGLAGVTRGTTAAVGGTRALTNEMRVLEGAMPIRAAASFLAQIGPLNAAMQTLFPIFGAIALVGVLDTILDKTGLLPKEWDKVTEAQKKSYEEMDKQSKKFDELMGKLKHYQMEVAAGGDPKKLKLLEAAESLHDAGAEQNQISILTQQVDILRKMANPWVGGKLWTPSQAQLQVVGQTGVFEAQEAHDVGFWGNMLGGGIAEPGAGARELLPEYEARLRVARAQQQVDVSEAQGIYAGAGRESRKKQDEEALKIHHQDAEALKAAETALRHETESRLGAVEKLNIEYAHQLELVKAIHDPKIRAQATADYALGHAAAIGNWMADQAKGNRAFLGQYLSGEAEAGASQDRFGGKVFGEALKAQLSQLDKDSASARKIAGTENETEADQAKRSLDALLHGTSVAAKGGQISPQAAAAIEYSAKVSYAKQLYDIETQFIGTLYDNEDQKNEAYAAARKRTAEEVYRAEEEYQNALADMREKDLHKYQEMAGGLFDALHNHSVGPFLRNFALGQTKTVFENVAGPLLQGAGHAIGGLIPNINIPGIGNPLHGTIFDSANADPAKATRDNTKETAEQVKGLRGDIRALTGSSGLPGGSTDGGSGIEPGGAAGGIGGALGSTLGIGGGIGGTFGTLLHALGLGGTGSPGSVLSGGGMWPAGAISYDTEKGQYGFPGGEERPGRVARAIGVYRRLRHGRRGLGRWRVSGIQGVRTGRR